MNLCSKGHDEIVYDGRLCPVCEKTVEIEKLENNLSDLGDEISELKNENAELRKEVAAMDRS